MQIFTNTRTALTGLVAIGLSAGSVMAQKVDLDRFHFEASYLKLPQEYVEPANRTYGVRVTSSPSVSQVMPESAVYDRINVSGFQKTEEKPTVGITLTFGDVRFERMEPLTRTEERRDKDGKVTGRTSYYAQRVTYSTTGSFRVTGPKPIPAADQRVAEEKPKETKVNRFMSAVSSAVATGTTGMGKVEEVNQKAVLGGSLGQMLTFTTQEYSSATEAAKYVELNQASIRTNLITDYVNKSVATVNYNANNFYGYVPTTTREQLWILDSKKHPEYETQQEAIKAVKELMKGMSATESLATLAQNLQPVMDYFQTLKTKYASDDKQDRKMRYSAYYNLAALNYLLDRPDKAIEEANGLISNDYDTSDGKKYLELAEELKKGLTKHNMDSRHMKI